MMPDLSQLFSNMIYLIVGSTLVIILGTFLIIYLMGRSRRKKSENLMATGVQGVATVLALQDTGMLVNNNPRVTLSMEITLPNKPPYQATKTMVIPMIRMSQVQVGSTVQVVVDPSQPTNPAKIGLLLQ
jgi:hypothetical protein